MTSTRTRSTTTASAPVRRAGRFALGGLLRSGAGVGAALLVLSAAGCASSAASQRHEDDAARIQKNLATFDELDYEVFTGQKWAELHRSHSHDITVHWPDGHATQGIDKHVEDLKAMFVWAPDTRIKEHPIKIGQGEWTAVVGVIEGTFTEPMPLGGGKAIPPTGKAYRLRMATVGHWNAKGVMDEEYLFWDNKEFMKQIGLGE
ncbi:MAG: ester cyclase [Polyangiaceae bacterium]